jgi:hypothetical protein
VELGEQLQLQLPAFADLPDLESLEAILVPAWASASKHVVSAR